MRIGLIILESKIIVVADTADAMPSHRPHPPVGIKVALDEIQTFKGMLFDSNGVNAGQK